MATLGLDVVCQYFKEFGNGREDEYRPLLQALANEQTAKAAGVDCQPVAPGSRGALVNAQRLLAIAQEQIEAALRVSDEQPGETGQVETRRVA